MSEQKAASIEIRSIEGLGIYEGNESPYFGKPFIKISLTSKIAGDVGTKFPTLDFDSDFIEMGEDGKTIKRHISNSIRLFEAEMYKHAHQKVGDRVMFVYTFVYDALAIESKIIK